MTAGSDSRPFWERKTLAEMTQEEWESLCDGCGRCCLLKLADEDGGNVSYTDVACRLLDLESCRCSNYARRHRLVKDCVRLTPEGLAQLSWMPSTCGYRLLHEGKALYWWHPLVSGDPASVRAAGIAVAGRVVSERDVAEEDLERHIVAWPA
jgi:uncharacterized cysteine cluster protein YcgN (CxxCxxCC family)